MELRRQAHQLETSAALFSYGEYYLHSYQTEYDHFPPLFTPTEQAAVAVEPFKL
jgi:hypothetical protein